MGLTQILRKSQTFWVLISILYYMNSSTAQDITVDVDITLDVDTNNQDGSENQNTDEVIVINVDGVTVFGEVSVPDEVTLNIDGLGITVFGELETGTAATDFTTEEPVTVTDFTESVTDSTGSTEETVTDIQATGATGQTTEDTTVDVTGTEELTTSSLDATDATTEDSTPGSSSTYSATSDTSTSIATTEDADITTETSVQLTSTPDPGLSPRPTLNDGECDRETHAGCNVTNLERCTIINERAPRCRCLAGYARGKDGYSCVAVTIFMLSLPTAEPFSTFLYDPLSERYRLLAYEARDGLLDVLDSSLLGPVTMDVTITGFRESDDGTIIIDFKLEISQAFLASEDLVAIAVKDSIRSTLEQNPRGRGDVLKGTTILITDQNIQDLFVMEPDPCQDALLNYCSPNAVCVMVGGAFACQCDGGFLDQSKNPGRISGEICARDLSDCPCKHGGVCDFGDDGQTFECICPAWYIGPECEVDGRIILVAGCIVLVTFLFVCFAGCGRYYANKRGRSEFTKSMPINPHPFSYRPFFHHSWYQHRRFYDDSNKFMIMPASFWQQPSVTNEWSTSPTMNPVFSPRAISSNEQWNWRQY